MIKTDGPPEVSKLRMNASLLPVFPIMGMLGGLLLAEAWARTMIRDEFWRLAHVVRWGILGFFLGIVLIVAWVSYERKRITSVRGLMLFVISMAVLSWFVFRILFRALGY